MLDINVRPVRVEDADDINVLRRMEGVFETILALPSERLDYQTDFLESMGDRDFMYVAEVKAGDDTIVIGVAGLTIRPIIRERHRADFGIMVHKDYQHMGVGTALMSKLLDLADNWIMLDRIDLTVLTDNLKAIELYKKFGFEIEGTLKKAVIQAGVYKDEYVMGRIRTPKA